MDGVTATTPAKAAAVLLVDDEQGFLYSSEVILRAAGVSPVVAIDDSRRVMPYLDEHVVAAVVLDLSMPHLHGEELLRKLREEHPDIPVIVTTGLAEVETAVACMKTGAFDYLLKPVESSRFVSCVRRAVELRSLQEEVDLLKTRLLSGLPEREGAFGAIVTRDRKMLSLFAYLDAIARTGQVVLVTGETGVGKELIARAIHDLSGVPGAYVAVNVAGLDDTMFSDTLFGHRRGAYTGADQAREGLVARASRGTLFLDEVGDMKESSQIKLLRLLEDRKYYPLGSDVPRESDARVVCATAQNVQDLLARGRFRKDLYYRLAAHHVHVPPLRQRPGDLPLLADHFLTEAAASLKKRKPAVPPELMTLLSTYHFPGNVRELKQMVFNAMVQNKGGTLSAEAFRQVIGTSRGAVPAGAEIPGPDDPAEEAPILLTSRFPTLKEVESFLVAEALRRARDNQGVAASLLGITRQALNKRLIRSGRSSRPK